MESNNQKIEKIFPEKEYVIGALDVIENEKYIKYKITEIINVEYSNIMMGDANENAFVLDRTLQSVEALILPVNIHPTSGWPKRKLIIVMMAYTMDNVNQIRTTKEIDSCNVIVMNGVNVFNKSVIMLIILDPKIDHFL